MKYLDNVRARAVAPLCMLAGACGLLCGSSWAATQEPAPVRGASVGGPRWVTVGDKALDRMRGGFDLGGGLTVSFGITRAVYINGALVTATSFNIDNLGNITSAQIAQVNQQVAAALRPAAAAAGSAGSAGSGAVASAPVAAAGEKAAAMSLVVQNGPGNSFQAMPSSASIGTIIQNTLSNQRIQSQTVIDTSTNGLSMLKGLNSMTTMQNALINSIGGR